jgi:hypothetical protein
LVLLSMAAVGMLPVVDAAVASMGLPNAPTAILLSLWSRMSTPPTRSRSSAALEPKATPKQIANTV